MKIILSMILNAAVISIHAFGFSAFAEGSAEATLLSNDQVTVQKNELGLLQYFDKEGKALEGRYRINAADGYLATRFSQGLFDGNFKQVQGNKVRFLIEYCNGKPCGSYKSFYANGKIAKHKNYNKWHQLNGGFRLYSEANGRILRKSEYRQGIKDGAEVVYYATGLEGVKSQSHFIKGVKQGAEIIYFQQGGVEVRQQYEQGKLSGMHTKYSDSAEKIFDAHYHQGEYNGAVRMYLEGQLWILKHYRNGKLHGKWIEYDLEQKGATTQIKYFANDKEIEQKGWTK